MDLIKEQVQAGIAAGLALTDPESDIQVPMKHCAGALILRDLLISLGGGALALVPTMQRRASPGETKAPPNNRKKAGKKKPHKKKFHKKK